MSKFMYVVGGEDGWLRVKKEPSGVIISIPEHLKVDLSSSSGGRDYFKVLEGVYKDKEFSVISGNLTNVAPAYKAAAHLTYSLSTKTLNYPLGAVHAISENEPIPVGSYPIQIPDHPHLGGESYGKYAKTWFYLGYGEAIAYRGDRYIHPGKVSAGCITVTPNEWINFYRYLILCRSGNGKTVGSVNVVR